jgi:hypothetical protein
MRGSASARFLIDHRDPVPSRKRGTSDLDAIACEANFARRRRYHAGQDLDQRRLAGPVLSDDRVDLAAAKLEIDILQRGNAPIFLGDLSHFQKRSFGKRCLRERRLGHEASPS